MDDNWWFCVIESSDPLVGVKGYELLRSTDGVPPPLAGLSRAFGPFEMKDYPEVAKLPRWQILKPVEVQSVLENTRLQGWL